MAMYKLLYFVQYSKIPVTTMNDLNEYFFILMVIRKTLMFVSSREWLTILNKRLYKGTIDCASLCELCCCMSLIRNSLSYCAIDFLLVLVINHCARLKVYLLCLIVQRYNCSYNVNTHANSVNESSFALMKFTEVLMNVYLP